jgi:hypothetical protein
MKMVPVIKQGEKAVLFTTLRPAAAVLTLFGAMRLRIQYGVLEILYKRLVGS